MTADTDQPTLAVLKPCPFCGADGPEWVFGGDYVQCGSCLATMPQHDPDVPNQAQRWNTRTPHEPRPAKEDTVAFVQEWLMNVDYDPTKFDRDFAAAIDARVAAALATHSPTPRPVSEADVERVAKAIYDATHAGLSNCYAWDDEWEPHQEAGRGRYYTEARAAIPAALATHSPAPMAGEGVLEALDEALKQYDQPMSMLNGYELGERLAGDVAEIVRHARLRAAAHPSTQEGADRG